MNQTRIITGLIIAFSLLLAILYLPHKIILYFSSFIVGVSLWEHLRLRFHILISTSISLLFVVFLLFSPQNLLPLRTIIFVGLNFSMFSRRDARKPIAPPMCSPCAFIAGFATKDLTKRFIASTIKITSYPDISVSDISCRTDFTSS